MQLPDRITGKAIFLDKDGTLVKDVPYNVDPDLVIFEPGVIDGLKSLQESGFKLVIVSNQSGIAKGLFSTQQLQLLIRHFEQVFSTNNLVLSGFYFCPHCPDDEADICNCHKPMPGLLYKAASELNLSLEESWMIGDILNDVEAGKQAGCRAILINNGNETQWLPGPFRTADYITSGFMDAADFITMQTTGSDARK